MRTENQMMELVRAKLVARRRRRRTVAASAGGGVTAVLLAVVLLAGGTGQQGAVEDVRTGPGGGSSTTTTVAEDRGRDEGTTSTTTSVPLEAPDAGASASGAEPPSGSGSGAPTTVGPGGITPPGASGPGSGGPSGSGSGGPGGSGTPGGGPTPTTAPPSPTPTTEPPFRQWEQPLFAEDGDMDLDVNLRRWDSTRPDILTVSVHLDDASGTAVHGAGRDRPSVVLVPAGGTPIVLGDPNPDCEVEGPYMIESAHFEQTVEISIESGQELAIKAITMACLPEQDLIDFVTEIPTPTY